MDIKKALEVFGYANNEIAQNADIKADYRRLTKVYHPDNADTGDGEKFRSLKSAYSFLTACKSSGALLEGKRKKIIIEYGELAASLHTSSIKDITGESYERKEVVNSDSAVAFNVQAVVEVEKPIGNRLEPVEVEETLISKYEMAGVYRLDFEVPIERGAEVSELYLNLCGTVRKVHMSKFMSNIDFKFDLGNVIVFLRLHFKLVDSPEVEYVVHTEKEEETDKDDDDSKYIIHSEVKENSEDKYIIHSEKREDNDDKYIIYKED